MDAHAETGMPGHRGCGSGAARGLGAWGARQSQRTTPGQPWLRRSAGNHSTWAIHAVPANRGVQPWAAPAIACVRARDGASVPAVMPLSVQHVKSKLWKGWHGPARALLHAGTRMGIAAAVRRFRLGLLGFGDRPCSAGAMTVARSAVACNHRRVFSNALGTGPHPRSAGAARVVSTWHGPGE